MINLLANEPCPQRFSGIAPLKAALNSFELRFIEILKSEEFSGSELKAAVLMLEFPEKYANAYCSNFCSLLVHTAGKNYAHVVNYMDASISPNNVYGLSSQIVGKAFDLPCRRCGCMRISGLTMGSTPWPFFNSRNGAQRSRDLSDQHYYRPCSTAGLACSVSAATHHNHKKTITPY